MQIPLKSQDGITLLTQKKYCGENINIIPELQTKETAFSNVNQSITPDPGYAGLKEVKVNAIPDFDKYVRTDKENTFTETQIFEEPILVPNATIIDGSQAAVNADTLKKALDEKRDIVPIPFEGTRFYIANSDKGQWYAEGSTGAKNKYDVVQRTDNAQIKAPNQLQFPPKNDEYVCKLYTDANYYPMFKEDIGNGNILVNGVKQIDSMLIPTQIRIAPDVTSAGLVERKDDGQIQLPPQLYTGYEPSPVDAISLNYADDRYLQKTGGTITGGISLTKDLTVGGNLTVNGTTTTVDSTTLQVKDKLIEVAHGNTAPLPTPAGIVAPNYNGNDSGAMVFDNTGTAYVGDVTLDASGNIDVEKSHLQPLATRNLSADDDGKLVKWDEVNKTLVASTESLSDKLDKLTPTNTSMLYGITSQGSNQGFSTGTNNINQFAIPQRTVNGQIAMPNQVTYAPTDDQAISKRFADNNYERLRTPLFTGEFLYEISKSTTGTIQRSLHGYGVTAKPSSIVKRTTKGQIELPDQTASAPTDDQAISKGYADANYLKGALPTIGTSTSSKDLKKIVYTAESDIPATPEEGVEYACTDLIGEEDLAPSFVNKVNGKQNLLTFDTAPTANSTNPVTSGGIYDAISQFITIQVSDSLMGG